MIVRYSEKGWEIVLQRSHGLLAGQICAHWKTNGPVTRRVETLIATAEHDDFHDELNDPELNAETGGPKNFAMTEFDPALCDRLLDRGMAKGRYVGMLIARHLRFLYADYEKAKQYCRDLQRNERQWLKDAGADEAELSASYELLEFCDALSLIICQGITQPEQRKMDISNGPDGKMYQLAASADGVLNVTPWPFEQDRLTLYFESRTVGQLAFDHAGQFRDQLKAAPVQTHTVVFARASD